MNERKERVLIDDYRFRLTNSYSQIKNEDLKTYDDRQTYFQMKILDRKQEELF